MSNAIHDLLPFDTVPTLVSLIHIQLHRYPSRTKTASSPSPYVSCSILSFKSSPRPLTSPLSSLRYIVSSHLASASPASPHCGLPPLTPPLNPSPSHHHDNPHPPPSPSASSANPTNFPCNSSRSCIPSHRLVRLLRPNVSRNGSRRSCFEMGGVFGMSVSARCEGALALSGSKERLEMWRPRGIVKSGSLMPKYK